MVLPTRLSTDIMVMPITALQRKLDQTPFLYGSGKLVLFFYYRVWHTQILTDMPSSNFHSR